mmetsp:Transcript_40680/g.113001  ORF Transcript_40680/g.113001 Transcript_40680/m.113001 type:complete len:214 (-) Transcript_40680:1621-2262(-)
MEHSETRVRSAHPRPPLCESATHRRLSYGQELPKWVPPPRAAGSPASRPCAPRSRGPSHGGSLPDGLTRVDVVEKGDAVIVAELFLPAGRQGGTRGCCGATAARLRRRGLAAVGGEGAGLATPPAVFPAGTAVPPATGATPSAATPSAAALACGAGCGATLAFSARDVAADGSGAAAIAHRSSVAGATVGGGTAGAAAGFGPGVAVAAGAQHI